MKIIDTHCHYNSKQYADRDAILNEMHKSGVEYIVDVGTNLHQMKDSLALCNKFPFVYSGLGFFPNDCLALEDVSVQEKFIDYLISSPKVAYLGEIGLDYYWNKVSHEDQLRWFDWQINLAKIIYLPVSIHSRDAKEDTIKLLNKYSKVDGIIHCFSYDTEAMEFFVSKGLYLGVGGTITYPSNKAVREAIKRAPLDRLVTETDAPYLTPTPFRRQINNSTYIKYVIEEISKLKELPIDEVEKQLYKNAIKALNLKGEH